MQMMQRVMITGQPGSGKSTLARALGERTGLPVFHMDHIHWKAGWVERKREEKTRLTREIHRKPQWILEGGHSATFEDRLAHADTFIWLDIPLGLRVWRVLKRSVKYHGRTRPDLPEGCPEQLNAEFIEFIVFIWRTRHTSRKRLQAIYEDPPADVATYQFRNLREINDFVDGLEHVYSA